MATHTPFHGETQQSADAAGDAIDEYLLDPTQHDPAFEAAIATDAGYSQLRLLLGRAISKHVEASHHAELGQVIEFMSADKSNDWSDEIKTLEGIERELVALRSTLAKRKLENETYLANIGPVSSAALMGRYARLGRFTAISLGANEEWRNDDLTEDLAQLWIRLGGTPQLSDDASALPHWRELADRFGIAHDGDDEGGTQ